MRPVQPTSHLVPPSKTPSLWGALAIAACLLIALPGVASADNGFATWYGAGFQGNVMYYGGYYDMYDPTTTASNMFPAGTWLKVTNPANGRSVVVQVRDRGNFDYAFDLSYAAFKILADPAVMGIPVTYHIVTGPSGQSPGAPAPAPAVPAPPIKRSASGNQYVVVPGDTLSDIAASFNLESATLASWNGIGDPNSIAPGQTLRLAAPISPPASVSPRATSYVVQAGDSLLGLAARFGVTEGQLGAANNLSDPNSIVIGHSIIIPADATASAARKASQYTVQPGDTLFGMAAKLKVSEDQLASANQITDPTNIQPGTVLSVPAS